MDLAVLYEDNHLLAVAKPCGVPTAPDASGDESLLDAAREWVRAEHEKPGRAWLGLVHRLDRPVSGVVLFARTSKAAARLSAQLRAGSARKTYWAVAEGALGAERGDEGELEQWLAKDPERNVVRALSGPAGGAVLAVTRWRRLGAAGGRTFLELEPRTGRPHQLRAAAAALGSPLLGDLKYGAREALSDRSVALHARRLAIEHPTRRASVILEAEAPERPWWRGFPAP